MLPIDLLGKTALVVGGSRGIGGAISETLARAGAHVTFTHTDNPARRQEVEALLARITEQGGHADHVAVDACDAAGMQACIAALLASRGKLDILVHNVGQNLARPAETVTPEEWQHFLDLNLTSAYLSVHAVLPAMLAAAYGRILLIGSSAVYSGGGERSITRPPKPGCKG